VNKEEIKMGGIVFFKTTRLDEVSHFYRHIIGCDLWLDQGKCHILKYGNMLFGLCQREKADLCGMITFVYPDRKGVDQIYGKIKDTLKDNTDNSVPRDHPEYRIYHFFTRDPEGRSVEFQYFWDDLTIDNLPGNGK
jgi:catechol-2,3-dioxygenase